MSKTLLLVEDSFSIQKVVDSTFSTAGYDVVIADSARDGLNTLSRITPDIILIDAAMTEMDGFQLCQAVRLTDGLAQVPVLLLTSRFTVYDEDLGKRVGVSACLAKPFDSFTLYSLVQQLISTPSNLVYTVSESPIPSEIAPEPSALSHSETSPSSPAVSETYQALGRSLQHIVEEAVQTHIATLLDALTPHLVDEIRTTLSTQVPEILENLLQQEIDKLKQNAQAEPDATSPDPS